MVRPAVPVINGCDEKYHLPKYCRFDTPEKKGRLKGAKPST
jgi:hypothetical protein